MNPRRRLLLPAVVVAACLLPTFAGAQFLAERSAIAVDGGHGNGVILRFEPVSKSAAFNTGSIPLIAGYDNVWNLTVTNTQSSRWFNATFTFNVTGTTVTPEEIVVTVAPRRTERYPFTLHPEDVGRVAVEAEAAGVELPQGGRARAFETFWAVPPVSVRFLDPPPQALADESGEYAIVSQRGPTTEGAGFIRIRPGESVIPRLEVSNPLERTLPAFELELTVPGPDRTLGRIEVPPLEAKETRIIEFPEYAPAASGGSEYYDSGRGRGYDLRPMTHFKLGELTTTTSAWSFRLESGAVTDLTPALATVEVRDGITVDVYVPTNPVLGAPTRVKFNVTNYGLEPTAGRVTITLEPPGRLHFGVQGPESRSVGARLDPGETISEVIEFTPRVTGTWSISQSYEDPRGGRYGTGGSAFEIPSPVLILADTGSDGHASGIVYARIGEPVQVDLSVITTETLQGAELRVASESNRGWQQPGAGSGPYLQGLSQSLLTATGESMRLGTLRPGGALNTTLEVSADASGRYRVYPYVLAEGFAYTSAHLGSWQGDADAIPVPASHGPYMNLNGFEVAVQTRVIAASWALAPLTVGIGLFVGTWTLRTRFVR